MPDRTRSIPRVFSAWEQGKRANAGNCWTDGVAIFTYGVPLVERVEGQPRAVVFNASTYSSTSSAHRNAIRAELDRAGYDVRAVEGPGVWDADTRLKKRMSKSVEYYAWDLLEIAEDPDLHLVFRHRGLANVLREVLAPVEAERDHLVRVVWALRHGFAVHRTYEIGPADERLWHWTRLSGWSDCGVQLADRFAPMDNPDVPGLSPALAAWIDRQREGLAPAEQ